MDYITEAIKLEPSFPLAVMRGAGFSLSDSMSGRDYMHRHSCLEINLCLGGNGRYYIADGVYPIETGDLFIINDLEFHRAINLSGDMLLLVVVFDPSMVLSGGDDYALIRAFYEWKAEFKHRIAHTDGAAKQLSQILFEIDAEFAAKENGWRMVSKALLIKFLALTYRCLEQSPGCGMQVMRFLSDFERISAAIALIESDFRGDLSLKRLAESVHMSPNYFSTRFSGLMSQTVSEYIMNKRLGYAALLLASGSESVLDIALGVGFNSAGYFSRAFAKTFGLSPSAYRKSARSGELHSHF